MKSFPIDNQQDQLLSVKELEDIDAVCVQFERQLKLGNSPNIEMHLNGRSDQVRDAMLVELLRLEIDYRRRRGLRPSREEYDSRFPHETLAIKAAFEETGRPDHVEPGERLTALERDYPLPFDTLDLRSQFKLERFHARGGLGEVYLAHDNRLDRPVAIKLPRNRDPNSPDHLRLAREAAITSRLKHPGIIPVYATGDRQDALPYYIMPFIEGQTFRDAILDFHSLTNANGNTKFSGWDFRRLLQRLLAVCNTVAYAHRQGVIHRDIKPANIMLGEFGETFLLDWGLAKHLRQSGNETQPAERRITNPPCVKALRNAALAETQPGQPIGTPEFASPEQVMGRIEEHSERSDVYSLGATLYYLLLGKAGVEFGELTNLATASALRRIAAPRSSDPAVPADLSAICQKAMSFDAADRYQTAAELANDLERFLADERVSVSRPGWTTNVRRRILRKPRLASSLATGIVLALLGTSLGAWMLNRKADELAIALNTQQQTSNELQQAKDSAEGYANDAMDALKTLSGRVVKQWFAEQKSFSTTEKEFLQQIVDQYQDLARAQSDEWFSRTIQAEAYHAVAQIQMLLGQNAEAMLSIDKVIALLTPIPDDADRTPRVLKATIQIDKGKLLFAGGEREAGTSTMKQGIDLLAALAADFPDEAGFRETLANAMGKLGATYVTAHQWDLAIEQFHAAKLITAELVERHPDNIIFLAAHESKTSNLGVALANKGDHEAAMIEYQAASEMYDDLFERDAIYSDVYRASGVPVHYIAVANSLIQLDRSDEAVEYFERAAQVAQQLNTTYPMFPGGYVSLARAHHGLASVLLAKREFETAISESTLAADAAGTAVELSPQEQNFRVRKVIQKQLASALEKNGDAAGAESAFLKLIQFAEEQNGLHPSPENSMSTAGDYLRLVKYQTFAQKYSDAMASLERAIELFESIPESSPLFPSAQSFLEKSKLDLAKLRSE